MEINANPGSFAKAAMERSDTPEIAISTSGKDWRFTPEDAREIYRQLGAIFDPPQPAITVSYGSGKTPCFIAPSN